MVARQDLHDCAGLTTILFILSRHSATRRGLGSFLPSNRSIHIEELRADRLSLLFVREHSKRSKPPRSAVLPERHTSQYLSVQYRIINSVAIWLAQVLQALLLRHLPRLKSFPA